MAHSAELALIEADRFNFIATKTQEGMHSTDAVIGYNQGLLAMARDQATRDISAMPWLPQLPEAWAQDIFERIESKENELIGDDYEHGTAKSEHEIREVSADSTGQFIFTAEHATRPVRRKKNFERAMADVGTGGLAAVLGEDYGKALIAVGNQTRPFMDDPDYEMNKRLELFIPKMSGFIAVHAMASGKFVDFEDRTEIHAILGLGANPSEYQREYAERVINTAEDLGLRAVIGNDTKFMTQEKRSHEVVREEDGSVAIGQLTAKRKNSTTSFVQNGLTELHRQQPAFQIELTRFLRYQPKDDDERDPVSRTIGTALGYKLIESAVKILEVTDENNI